MADSPPPGSRHRSLKKSFEIAMRPLLSQCSMEDVDKLFSPFTKSEREGLCGMLSQVFKSLYEHTQEEFEDTCKEAQVGRILDEIEQLVEERSLDIPSENKPDIEEVKKQLLKVKQNEVDYLRNAIAEAEEQNNHMKAHIASLKSEQTSTATAAIEKLKNWSQELIFS